MSNHIYPRDFTLGLILGIMFGLSNKKAMEAKEAETSRLRTELAHVKQQLADLQESTS